VNWNKEQIAAFATYAHQEGWVAKLNQLEKDSPIFDGSLQYLDEKAGFINNHPEAPDSALDLANKRKFNQMLEVLSKVV
jgi:hypothetical protein